MQRFLTQYLQLETVLFEQISVHDEILLKDSKKDAIFFMESDPEKITDLLPEASRRSRTESSANRIMRSHWLKITIFWVGFSKRSDITLRNSSNLGEPIFF